MYSHCRGGLPLYLVLLEQDVDAGQVFAVVVALQLTLQVFEPDVEGGAALREELRPVGIEQALGLGLRGLLQLLPLALQLLQGLLYHRLQLGLLRHQLLTFLLEVGTTEKRRRGDLVNQSMIMT